MSCPGQLKRGSLKCKGWFEDVQQGEWSALKQLYCFLNGHLTTSCRPCNHPLGRALTKSRVCKREIQQTLLVQSIDFVKNETVHCTVYLSDIQLSVLSVPSTKTLPMSASKSRLNISKFFLCLFDGHVHRGVLCDDFGSVKSV